MTPTDTQAATRVTRLSRVVLEDDGAASLPPLIEADRAQAVADLAAANRFALLSRQAGAAMPTVPMPCISPSATAGWCSMSGMTTMPRSPPSGWRWDRSAR